MPGGWGGMRGWVACVVKGAICGQGGAYVICMPPMDRLLRDMVGQCASVLLECILVSNYISFKYIRSRFKAVLTRLASVTADLCWSPLLFSGATCSNCLPMLP